MKFRNLPDIPQWEIYDFLRPVRIIFDISIGEVFIESIMGIPSSCSKCGGESSGLGTLDFEEK